MVSPPHFLLVAVPTHPHTQICFRGLVKPTEQIFTKQDGESYYLLAKWKHFSLGMLAGPKTPDPKIRSGCGGALRSDFFFFLSLEAMY